MELKDLKKYSYYAVTRKVGKYEKVDKVVMPTNDGILVLESMDARFNLKFRPTHKGEVVFPANCSIRLATKNDYMLFQPKQPQHGTKYADSIKAELEAKYNG